MIDPLRFQPSFKDPSADEVETKAGIDEQSPMIREKQPYAGGGKASLADSLSAPQDVAQRLIRLFTP